MRGGPNRPHPPADFKHLQTLPVIGLKKGRAIKELTPPPLELYGRRYNLFKKRLYSMARPLHPSPNGITTFYKSVYTTIYRYTGICFNEIP